MEEKNEKNDPYKEMMENLRSLNKEAKEKKEELDIVKQQIKQSKLIYNQKIKEYNDLMNTVMQKENIISNIHQSIDKFRYLQEVIMNQITSNFILSFKHTINSIKPEGKLSLCAFFNCSDMISFDFLILILNTPDDWKKLLRSITDEDRSNHLRDEYQYNKNNYSIMMKPLSAVDVIFDFIHNYFLIKQYTNQLKTENIVIYQLNETKNYEFIHLKSIESEIIKKDCIYRNIIRYIKGIYSLFDKYNKIKLSIINNTNANGNTATLNGNPSTSQCSPYVELAKSILDFKKINIMNYCGCNFMTRSTIKSEFSEEMSYLSFQAQDIGLNQSSNNYGSNTNGKDNRMNLSKKRNSNKKEEEEEVIFNIKHCTNKLSKESKVFQHFSAYIIQKCSEGKLHQKKLIDNNDRFDDSDYGYLLYKDDNVATEDSDEKLIKDKTINCYSKECNNRNDKESNNNNQIIMSEQSFDTNDVECDLNSRNATELKQVMNSISVQPSKMIEERLRQSRRKMNRQSIQDQL